MLVNTPHPVLACVDNILAELAQIANVEPAFMRTADKADALIKLVKVETMLAALRMQIMATADDVAEETGARDVAAWLAHETHASPNTCRAELHLAAALDTRWTRLGTAVAAGGVNLAQARVIARALDELPGDLDPALLVQAEAYLVDAAGEYRPEQLRVLGRKILDVIAPEIGEAEEAKQLAREEVRAWETTSLTLTRRGDGTTRLSGLLPDATAARLVTYLDAYTSPRQTRGPLVEEVAQQPLVPEEVAQQPSRRARNQGQARGQAFCSLLEHLDPAKLPAHGGDATTVIVTIDHDALTKDLASAGLLGTDEKITASEARRLACNAKILPAVLGGKSEILDFGRSRRIYSGAQRKAMRLRDQTVPRRGLLDFRDLVRSPSLGALVNRRKDRPGRRRTAVFASPPPSPRQSLFHGKNAERRYPIPPQNINRMQCKQFTDRNHRPLTTADRKPKGSRTKYRNQKVAATT